MLHNEHLVRYTPYRIRLVDDLDWRATPEAATSALGAPTTTSTAGEEVVVMSWERGSLRLVFEFAPPRPPAPPGVDPDRPLLRIVKMEVVGDGGSGGGVASGDS
jgi:hypothetical protein